MNVMLAEDIWDRIVLSLPPGATTCWVGIGGIVELPTGERWTLSWGDVICVANWGWDRWNRWREAQLVDELRKIAL